MAALNAAAPRITDRLCDAVRRALRRRPRAPRRARRAVPARARSRPRPRLLHADRVRVLRHRSRGPAAGARRRRALRRPGRAARWAADARDRVRDRARSAGPGPDRDRRRRGRRERRRSRSSSAPIPTTRSGGCVVATDLRAAGIAARAELGHRKLGKQLEAAAREQAHFAVILGDELVDGRGRAARPAGRDPEADRHRRPGARDRARARRAPPRDRVRLIMSRDARWSGGDDYESYVGRWSRSVAPRFIDGLLVPPGARWLDVGSGTGALTGAILDRADPVSVVGIDPSRDFVERARRHRHRSSRALRDR